MSVEEVYPGIFRIPVGLPHNPLKELNSYFIPGRDRNLLIDTGFRMEECRADIERGIVELGADMDKTDIFVTHLHSDHAGLAPDLIRPGRKIYISRTDGCHLVRSFDPFKRWEELGRRYIAGGMPPDVFYEAQKSNPALQAVPAPWDDYTFVEAGTVLQAGPFRLECLAASGHTPGQLCLWDADHGILFTADNILFDITPNITAWPEMEDALGTYLDTLRRFRDIPVRLALPGHRKTGDYHQRIDRLLAHHQARLADTRHIIESEPGLPAYEIAGRMKWKIRADSWETFPGVQKIFAVGECFSHLDYLRLAGIIRRGEGKDGIIRYYPA